MSSFVSAILHTSAIKIESMSKRTQQPGPPQEAGSRLAAHAATGYYYSPPPPYDSQKVTSPTPTPSTSWTSEMSALAEKIKDDVTNTFKGTKASQTIDRHSISQGMKLVSIAADEYEQGNESVALGLYLTGVDKVLMALPNKTDMNTRIAIKEKLLSVEERVGIAHLQGKATMTKKEDTSSMTNMCIISDNSQSMVDDTSMNQFKQFGQQLAHTAVTCAILVKKSPLPGLVCFLSGYILQLIVWIDSQYHFIERLQQFSIQCIKYILEADEKYHLHEFVTEGLYMMAAAGLKAAVAFKETPGYDDTVPNKVSVRKEPCSPPTPQKTTSSWFAW